MLSALSDGPEGEAGRGDRQSQSAGSQNGRAPRRSETGRYLPFGSRQVLRAASGPLPRGIRGATPASRARAEAERKGRLAETGYTSLEIIEGVRGRFLAASRLALDRAGVRSSLRATPRRGILARECPLSGQGLTFVSAIEARYVDVIQVPESGACHPGTALRTTSQLDLGLSHRLRLPPPSRAGNKRP